MSSYPLPFSMLHPRGIDHNSIAQIEYRVLNAALEYKRLPGGCGNRQVPQFNPSHRQQLPMRRKSCDTNICHLEFGRNKDHSPVIKPSSHTLVQLLYNSYLNLIPSIHITSIRLSITGNNDHINLGAWFLASSSSSPVPNTMSVVS